MLSKEIAEVLNAFFFQGKAAARPIIVKTIRETSPELDVPTLDLEVGRILNRLVDRRLLVRSKSIGNIRFYGPGKNLIPSGHI